MHTFVPKKNVGFGLGWDTQPKNPKSLKTFPKKNTQKFQFLGFLGQISGFLGQIWEKFSEFWDIWVKVLVIFGLGLGLLGLVWVGISWDLGVPTQNPRFFGYKCMLMCQILWVCLLS